MIDIQQKYNKLIISNFNEAGSISTYEYDIDELEYYAWIKSDPKVDDEQSTSWLKDYESNTEFSVSKRYLSGDRKDPKFLNKYRIIEYLQNLPKDEKDKIFGYHTPKTYFYDIEVDVTEDLSSALDVKNAPNPVTLITLCDNHTNKMRALGTKPMDSDQKSKVQSMLDTHLESYDVKLDFKYVAFKNEYFLLKFFFENIVPKTPVLIGWNSAGYDWPYLFNRAKKYNDKLGENSINLKGTSPTNQLSQHVTKGSKKKGNYQIVAANCMPKHRLLLDQMQLYSKFIEYNPNINTNFLKLDRIAALHLNSKKLNIDFIDDYKYDYEKYVAYGCIDTYLLKLLDQKLKVLNIFLMLGSITESEYSKAFGPIHMTETQMSIELLKRNKVIIEEDIKKIRAKNGKFSGAVVLNPDIGFYRWVACFDFSSLYPTIMRQSNISPETFIHRKDKKDSKRDNVIYTRQNWIKTALWLIDPEHFDATLERLLKRLVGEIPYKVDGKKEKIKITEKSLLKGIDFSNLELSKIENQVYTACGSVFDNSEPSVFNTILTRIFTERKKSKKDKFNAAAELNYLKEYKLKINKTI